MSSDPIALRGSQAAFARAQQALDELIVLALVRGPQKIQPLRAAVAPFGPEALRAALKRLQADGELVGEGQTQARIYRLMQRSSTATPPSAPAIRRDGQRTEARRFLTAGVDVQKDRVVYEVVSWGRGKRSWSIDYGELPGDTADLDGGPWQQVDDRRPRSTGSPHRPQSLSVPRRRVRARLADPGRAVNATGNPSAASVPPTVDTRARRRR